MNHAYLSLESGRKVAVAEALLHRIDRMYRMRCPAAVYPFLMRVIREAETGNLATSVALELFDVVESFLVRRAVVGYEPTGLHALFKNVWSEIADSPSGEAFANAARQRPTIQWPKDDTFVEGLRTRPLARSNICGYLLVEIDRMLPGDDPMDRPTIEHVVPQSLPDNGSWARAFDEEQHKELVHTLANLVPMSGTLNSSMQAAPYDAKRERFLAESMYCTPRHVAQTYRQWNPETVGARAEELVKIAVKRWPD